MSKLLQNAIDAAPNRRRFLNTLTIAGVAAASANNIHAQNPALTDVDVLNFALNLEYLDSEFFSYVAYGRGIESFGVDVSGQGTAGPVSGARQVTFGADQQELLRVFMQLAEDERAHVRLIRQTIQQAGGQPIARPAINLNAMNMGFADFREALVLARVFEDVGVSAYAAAAPLIQDRNILASSARIAQAEAEHVGNVRAQIARYGVPTMMLDGADVLPPPSGDRYFSVDPNGLTYPRTPAQVLFLVYGMQANVTQGGFFPNGVNGNTRTSGTGVSLQGRTVANLSPAMLTTTQSQVVLNAAQSTSAAGTLSYTYSVEPGGLAPALLQIPGSPNATVQFVNGPGTYLVRLRVTDEDNGSATTLARLVYQAAGTPATAPQ